MAKRSRSHPLTLRVASENAVNEVKVSGSLDSATVAIDGGLVLATRLAQRDREEYLTLDSETHRARFRIDGATTWSVSVERRGPRRRGRREPRS